MTGTQLIPRIDPMARVSLVVEADSDSSVNLGSMLLASTIRAYPYVSMLALVYYFLSLHLVVLPPRFSFIRAVKLKVIVKRLRLSLLPFWANLFWANRKRCKVPSREFASCLSCVQVPFDSRRTQAIAHLLSSTIAVLQHHVFSFRPLSTYFPNG
jgi:hypothetical protein